MNINKLSGISALVLLAVSCSAPAEISYFQDTASMDKELIVSPQQIKLQPEDKISIIVNCKDNKLTNLFNLPYVTRRLGSETESVGSMSQGMSGYTIDSDGDIDFPVIGLMHVSGLTREQVAVKVHDELVGRDLVKDPVVTVDFMNLSFSMMGEVARPGRYSIVRDHITILDALSMAGDLTIYGRRDNIRVIREKDGRQKTYRLNLCSAEDVVASPVFYIQQNDIIYVEPNEMRARQSTVNGNNVRSTSFWISIASLAATLVTTVSVVASRAGN